MKNTILILMIALFGLSSYAQVELKGMKLGEINAESQIITSVGGVDGAVIASELNDGRTYSIMFAPSEDGVSVDRIYQSQIDVLIKGFENKYGIKFRKVTKSKYEDDSFYYSADKDGVEYLAVTDHNQFSTPTTEFTIFITNSELKKIREDEEQNSANSDF